MNIAVAGTGYVGMSIATLLSQHNHVVAVDVIPEKVEKINKRISPIQDDYIEKYLKDPSILPCVGETNTQGESSLYATLDGASAYKVTGGQVPRHVTWFMYPKYAELGRALNQSVAEVA